MPSRIQVLFDRFKNKEEPFEIMPGEELSKKEVEAAKNAGYDLDFLNAIQPQGGIYFEERQTVSADGYSKVLYVTGYPNNTNIFWLAWLTNNPYTIATVDIKSASNEEELDAINRALNELEDRAQKERQKTDQTKAARNYQSLMQYASELNSGGEVAKLVRVRIFVYASTQEQLETRVVELRKELKGHGFRMTPLLFEEESHFRSLFMSYSQQDKRLVTNHRGQSMQAAVLGKGVPFHQQSLQDPLGYPIGTTQTGGTFIFDQFRTTSTRRAFNQVVLGRMGFGKSTYLKLIEEATVARGNRVRIIDKTKEYEHLVTKQGGLVINLDGSQGRINPWEVYATVTDADGLVINERSSFQSTLANLTSQLRLMNRDFSDTDAMEARKLIQLHYRDYGLNPAKITGLDPTSYPTYRTFLDFVKKVKETKAYQKYDIQAKTVERLTTTVSFLLDNYGEMFDGPSTIRNLSEEPIVSFDISSISTADKNIFQLQISSALQLIWSDALKNGRRQNYLLREHKIQPQDIVYFNVFFDECHNLINANNPDAVEYVSNFEREMRKFRAGIILATQSPQEMMPEGASGADIAKLKTIFELTQYKVIFANDDSIMKRLSSILGTSLNESEYAAIPELKVGHAIVSFGSKESYRVEFNPSKRQLADFRGQ